MAEKVTVSGRITNHVFRVKEIDGKRQYSANLVLDPGQGDKIREGVKRVLAEKYNGKKPPKGFQDWTVRKGEDEEYDVSFGKEFINAKTREDRPPQFKVRRNGKMMQVTDEEGVIYPGANVAVSVSLYAYDGDKKNNIKPGVTCGLRAIMFMSNNEPLGDNVSDDEFDNFESEEDEDFDGSEDWGN